MGDTVKKTAKYWNEQYHVTLLLFPDELRVMKGAVTKRWNGLIVNCSRYSDLLAADFCKNINLVLSHIM